MTPERVILWITFNLFVFGMLALDLGIFHRKAHAVSLKEASIWSAVWIVLALVFDSGIYFVWGPDKALEFVTGYVIEKSLSVDNLFVFLMIFRYFATPAAYQHRILFWGIVGALFMRALFIATGAALLENFHWMIYVFGAFLIITGIKMLLQADHELEPDKNPVVRLFHRWIPMTEGYHGQHFFVRQSGKWHATLLMLVLVVVETTDIIFAVDSIPAIFAISRDPFIVYTSNVFAILGLRALYFLLAGVMEMFIYLRAGLAFVLCFVGLKMLAAGFYPIPIGLSLAIIGAILTLSIVASLWAQREESLGSPRLPTVAIFSNWGRHDALKPVPAPAFARLPFFGIAIAAILIIVKLTAIEAGPSGSHAITAIRVAQNELNRARRFHGQAHPGTIRGAERALEQARANLNRNRYEAALSAATKARKALATLPRRE